MKNAILSLIFAISGLVFSILIVAIENTETKVNSLYACLVCGAISLIFYYIEIKKSKSKK